MKTLLIVSLVVLISACAPGGLQPVKSNETVNLPVSKFEIQRGKDKGTFYCKVHEPSRSLLNCAEVEEKK